MSRNSFPRTSTSTYLRRDSRSNPIADIPNAGTIIAPKPKSNTKGATLVISPGTSEPRVPSIVAVDWRDWVAVLLDEDVDWLPLPVVLLELGNEESAAAEAKEIASTSASRIARPNGLCCTGDLVILSLLIIIWRLVLLLLLVDGNLEISCEPTNAFLCFGL